MIAVIASIVLLGNCASTVSANLKPQQPQSLLQQVIPKPTGNNGYEEYLMACDIVRAARNTWLFDATPQRFEETIAAFEVQPPKGLTKELLEEWEMDRPSLEEYQRAKKYRHWSVLQLRREAFAGAGKALDVLNRGNKKPVFDPRPNFNLETLFPEYAQMKALAKLAVTGAYVAFAEGRSKQGTQYLCDAIILGNNISDGVLIARLVGVAIQSIGFAAIEKHLSNLSSLDARELESLAPQLIGSTPMVLKSIDKEFKFMDSSLDEIFNSAVEMDYFSNSEETTIADESANQFLAGMSPAQEQQLISLCRVKLKRHHALMR
ncbi:MAG: hypothetical protein H7Y17_02505, partial [Chlorobia bacterium]|nr:hypothetical protein [Fimbriimonadaceae bacterium]